MTISIAMTTYNGGKYLAEQLDSLYAQTRLPDEVVVCDDCSTDNTVEILEKYSKQYGLRYSVNKDNVGYNRNFQQVLQQCTGDYICICDQDDVWLPDKIEKQYQAMRQYDKPNEPVVVVSRAISVDARLNRIGRCGNHSMMNWKYSVWGETTQGCSVMMNRATLRLVLPIPDGIIYDAYIGISAALCGEWHKMSDFLMLYRYHDGNAVGHQKTNNLWGKIVKETKYGLLAKDEHFDLLKRVADCQSELAKPERLREAQKALKAGEAKTKAERIRYCFSFPYKGCASLVRAIVSVLLS